jgi:hypothetical protein
MQTNFVRVRLRVKFAIGFQPMTLIFTNVLCVIGKYVFDTTVMAALRQSHIGGSLVYVPIVLIKHVRRVMNMF